MMNPLPQIPGPSALAPDATGSWIILHTKSRQEKALSADLLRMGVSHYVPLVERVRFYGKRKALVEEPVFPGYVFLRGALEDAYRADRTKRVANIIKVGDQSRLEWELKNLELALSRKVALDPYPALKVGRKVEVRAGPLRGLQGFVEDRIGWNRLILTVDMLGQACSLEVDASLLDPID
jgi:transcription antitermination factor NusG